MCSLLDNAPNYVVGSIIQKRTCKHLHSLAHCAVRKKNLKQNYCCSTEISYLFLNQSLLLCNVYTCQVISIRHCEYYYTEKQHSTAKVYCVLHFLQNCQVHLIPVMNQRIKYYRYRQVKYLNIIAKSTAAVLYPGDVGKF